MVMMTREEYYAQIKEMYAQKYESPSMKAWRSGSDHFERSGDDRWFSEEDRRFREYLMSRNDDDDETWTWTETDLSLDDETDFLEEKSTSQFQVPIDNSEIVRSIEPGKVDLELERLEVVTDKKEPMEVDISEVEHKTESEGRAEEPPKSAADEVHVQSIELVVRDQAQEARSDVVSSLGVNVTRVGAIQSQPCISGRANRVWKPGGLLCVPNKKFEAELEIYDCETKKQINIDHISLNGMCNKLVYDEEKKKLRHVGDDVKKGKNSFLRDVKIILALAVKEYRMGKADERLLPGHYGLLHTFDQRGGLNATVIAGTIMQSSLKLFHQLRVACLHHTSLGFLYGSLPRPPEENHSNFSNMLQYHETWSCISLRTNRVWDPGGSNSETN